MIRGMEAYEDSTFEELSDIKGAVLGVLDNELEVFDPICDGSVEHAEGMAQAREIVELVFKEIEIIKAEREANAEYEECR